PHFVLRRGKFALAALRAKAGGRERTCTSKAHRFSICGVCCSRLTTRPKTGAPTRNCTELIRLPSERIAENALRAIELASLTGFAPVISCMRGRHVVWTTPQGQKWWEVLADGQRSAALSAASRMSSGGRAQAPLLMSYAPEMERVDGIAPSSQPWHGRILLLNHTRKRWCP